MTFESEGLLIIAIFIWLPPASYVVFLTTLVLKRVLKRVRTLTRCCLDKVLYDTNIHQILISYSCFQCQTEKDIRMFSSAVNKAINCLGNSNSNMRRSNILVTKRFKTDAERHKIFQLCPKISQVKIEIVTTFLIKRLKKEFCAILFCKMSCFLCSQVN